MKISYKLLMRQLLERNMEIRKNQPIKLDMLMEICETLHCPIEDVI